MIFVCCLWQDPRYRWGTRYTAKHVNVMRSMLRRHVSEPHELVCVTNMPEGIDPDVRIVPLWDDGCKLGNTWRKLKLFASEMAEIIGPRFCYVDLDCVVVDDLSPLMTNDDFVIWRGIKEPTFYNSSFFLLKAGAKRQVWESFSSTLSPRLSDKYTGWDQAWICYVLGRGERTWDKSDGVLNFRYEVGRRQLPANARIVFFPGQYDPSQENLQTRHSWIAQGWQ